MTYLPKSSLMPLMPVHLRISSTYLAPIYRLHLSREPGPYRSTLLTAPSSTEAGRDYVDI